ncbi:ATP-binding cassette domain-containing protein [Clostridiaceae bacterium M8S5]|nr:ATP-binding cassette domain-containing protein [Clostridiaceae bacterium M8S5]
MDIIQFENVTANYGKICALKNVTISVKKGEFISITGDNGSGKSTLLKLILGLKKPKTGKVIIARNYNIAYVPQFRAFDSSFPIDVKSVILQGRLKKNFPFSRYNKEDIKALEYYSKVLCLQSLLERQIGELSGGQIQKVLIARALIAGSDVLLLDEPTANIDEDSTKEILKILKNLNDKTIILVTHNTKDIVNYCDYILHIRKIGVEKHKCI